MFSKFFHGWGAADSNQVVLRLSQNMGVQEERIGDCNFAKSYQMALLMQ